MALVAAFLFGKVQEGCNLYGGVYEALGWHLPVDTSAGLESRAASNPQRCAKNGPQISHNLLVLKGEWGSGSL